MTAVQVPAFTRWCRPLRASSAESLVGGKAVALGRLIRAGMAVPDGFVLTSEAFDATDGGRLRADVREQLVCTAEPLLETGPVVVRSSAIGEDGGADSFAGQLDSVLHVRTVAALEQAVLTVWASLSSERALFYRKSRGLESRGMGVIVQRQVDASCAGVMFTATTSGEILVEYAPGLADALVQGIVDPTRVAIDRTTGTSRVLARSHDVEPDVDELRRIAIDVEREFGAPQDVEWALDRDGTIYVVQSRPITAPVALPAPRRRVAWSNANVNENFPRPISPLLYSIASAGYTHYFRNLAIAFGVSRRRVAAMEPAFRQIIGVHGARMYYNLTSIHSVLRLAPFGRALTASFDTFVGADGSDVNAEAVGVDGHVRQVVEVAAIAVKASRLFMNLELRVARFESTVDDFAARTRPELLDTMSLADLGRALAGFMEIRCHRWLDASLADAASMLCYGALERLLKRVYPNAAVHTSLLKAIPDVVSGEPVLALWDLSRLVRADAELHALFANDSTETLAAVRTDQRFVAFREAFDRYLDQWGFRCSEELMLTSPSFQEDPAPLIDMLREYANVDGESPRDTMRMQAAEREHETRRVIETLSPVQAALLNALLPRTHAAIRYRERARLAQALLYSRCRRIALAMGRELTRRGLLDSRDDVFFLTHSELTELASGGAMLPSSIRDVVRARIAEHMRASALTPPDAFTLDEGEYWEGQSTEDDSADGPLAGTPACTGVVTGRATVLGSVNESARLTRGEILVTKQTDPGWGPVFFLISGLVIERGGMLSHGAIIAREFGIPCVVGVKRAMERIPTGATITVNGNDGSLCVHE